MPKVTCSGAVLAEAPTGEFELVEGNVYFPPEAAMDTRYLREFATHSICRWKGTASYYNVVAQGEVNKDAAWYYPLTKPAASNIAG